MEKCCGDSCCLWCRNCFFCWRGCFYREEFLLDSFYEEITPQEWKMLGKEASQVKREASDKIVLVERNVLPPVTECNLTAENEKKSGKLSRSLVDYSASAFVNVDEAARETKSSKMRLNKEKFRSYTEPDFITEMWKTPKGTTARLTSLKEIFRRKRYAHFTNEESEDSSMHELSRVDSERSSISGGNEPSIMPHKQSFRGETEVEYDGVPETEPNPKLKVKTKILARRSQRPNREKDAENFSKRLAPSSVFNDFSQIEASISFAAHVRRQGPGFSASCTQTLRTCDFTSAGDLFESEVQSNVTFNPLFEDDDSDDERPVRPRRHRLYTIDEESEAYDSGY